MSVVGPIVIGFTPLLLWLLWNRCWDLAGRLLELEREVDRLAGRKPRS